MDFSDVVLADPSDWKFKPFRDLDALLRCTICFDYYQAAMIMPNCSHNYCSVCIRRFLEDKSECPTCFAPVSASQLKNNRILDELVKQFTGSRSTIIRRELMELAKSVRGRNGLKTLDFSSHPTGPRVEAQSAMVRNTESSGGASDTTMDVTPRDGVTAACVPQPPSLQMLGEVIAGAEQDVVKKEGEEGEEGEEFAQGCNLAKEVVELSTNVPSFAVSAGSDSTPETSNVPKMASLDTWKQSTLLPPPAQTPGLSATGGTLHPSSSSPSPSYSPASPSILTPAERAYETCHGVQTPVRPLASLPKSCRPCRLSTSEVEGGNIGVGAGAPHSPAVVTKVSCPICAELVVDKLINSHLDTCLSRTARQQAHTNPSPSHVHGLPRLPKLCTNILSNKQLKNHLKKYNLSTQGTKKAQIERLKEFRLQYNAQCDSLNPKTPEQIAVEVEKAEKARMSRKVCRDSSGKDTEKQRASYEQKHKDQFAKLLADVKKREKRTSGPSPGSSRGWREDQETEGDLVALPRGSGGNCSSDAPLRMAEADVLVVDSSDDESKPTLPGSPGVTVHRDVIPESPHSPRRKKRKCKQVVSASGMEASDSEEAQGGEDWDPDFEPTTPSFRHKKRRKF